MSVRKTPVKAAAETTAAVKTTPVKTEEVKTEVKTTAKAEPKTETAAAKKVPVRRGAAKKEAAAKKTTATKTAAKQEVKESVFIQFAGAEYDLNEIKANIKKAWTEETGKKESDIKDVQIYVKPEEKVAYYVVNGEFVEGGRKVDL